MKLLQLGMGWFPEQPGGLNRFYFDLQNSLDAAGVGLAGLVAGSSMAADHTAGRVRSFAPSGANIVSRWWAARQQIGRSLAGVDVVASHFAFYTLPALDLLRRHPLVVHFQGPWAAEGQVEGRSGIKKTLKLAIEKPVYRQASRLIVLSQSFGQILAASYGIPEKRIQVVPGGVDTARFDLPLSRSEARQRLGWPQGRPTLLAVRRLVRRMGLENLVEAVAEIRKRIPEVQLMIAGRGPLAAELAERVRSLDLSHHVKLLGFVPDADLAVAYRAADLSVVPTVALEGFGLITVESLAAGTPVLVTPVGGLPEVVSGLSENLIMRDAEVGSLYESLYAALDGSLLLPSADDCRQYARRNFDWSVIASRILDVYAEAAR